PLSRALASMAVRERVAFEGYEWHTHGDLLVGTYGATEAEAIRNFVGEVLSDRLPIAVCSRDGSVHDIRISDDPATEQRYASTGEQKCCDSGAGGGGMQANRPLEPTGCAGRSAPIR